MSRCSLASYDRCLKVGIFAVLRHEKAHILHIWTIVVDQEAGRLLSRIEMLVPAKHRDAERVALFPIESLIFDDAVTLAAHYIICLLIDVAVSAGALARRNFGDKSPNGAHIESGLRIHNDCDARHSRWLENKVLAANKNFSRAPLHFLFGSEIQSFRIQLVRFAARAS